MLDFGVLPPEVNSAKMYAGAGPGPLMAAAAAWEGIATSLLDAATQTSTMASGLGSTWLGPSSATMAAKVAQHVSWLDQTAAGAQETAAQAMAALAAYEAAFAATVPPPVIAANRALLATLVATNFLGINTPAIMATEAHYMEMWAQDATAMYTYAATSAQATVMKPFAPTITPTTKAPTQTISNPIPQSAQDVLLALGAPTTVWGMAKDLASFTSSAINGTNMASFVSLGYTFQKDHAPKDPSKDAAKDHPAAVAPVKPLTPNQGLKELASGRGAGLRAVSGVGNAAKVGKLSVPSAWTAQTETPVKLAAAAEATPFGEVGTPQAVSTQPGMVPFTGGVARNGSLMGPRYGKKLTVMGTKGI